MKLLNKIFDYMIIGAPYAFALVMGFMVVMIIKEIVENGGTFGTWLALSFGIITLVVTTYFNFIRKD
jgi:hypothetical protein